MLLGLVVLLGLVLGLVVALGLVVVGLGLVAMVVVGLAGRAFVMRLGLVVRLRLVLGLVLGLLVVLGLAVVVGLVLELAVVLGLGLVVGGRAARRCWASPAPGWPSYLGCSGFGSGSSCCSLPCLRVSACTRAKGLGGAFQKGTGRLGRARATKNTNQGPKHAERKPAR